MDTSPAAQGRWSSQVLSPLGRPPGPRVLVRFSFGPQSSSSSRRDPLPLQISWFSGQKSGLCVTLWGKTVADDGLSIRLGFVSGRTRERFWFSEIKTILRAWAFNDVSRNQKKDYQTVLCVKNKRTEENVQSKSPLDFRKEHHFAFRDVPSLNQPDRVAPLPYHRRAEAQRRRTWIENRGKHVAATHGSCRSSSRPTAARNPDSFPACLAHVAVCIHTAVAPVSCLPLTSATPLAGLSLYQTWIHKLDEAWTCQRTTRQRHPTCLSQLFYFHPCESVDLRDVNL